MNILSKILTAFFAATMLATGATVTWFTYQFQNSDGSPMTNAFTMQGWPPATSQVTVVSNSFVFSGGIMTNTPNSAGTGTNSAMPNNYKVFVPALNLGFFVNLTANSLTNPLAIYAVGTPVVYQPASQYAYLTNQLGYAPATNNLSGVVAALGYTPLTNTASAITNALAFAPATNGGSISYAQVTNGLAYSPATNSYTGIASALTYFPATNSTAGIVSALGYTPPPNTYAGLTNAAGFAFATNNPATNTIAFVSAVSGVTNGSGYVTNLTVTLTTNTINYTHQ